MSGEVAGRQVAVIGGGPAGMLSAIAAANAGASVDLYERNPLLGKKLRITGKGRCNVTNNCTQTELLDALTRNRKFLYSASARFSSADTMAFFEQAGVPLKTERGRRVFPVSDRAADIAGALEKRMREAGVRVHRDSRLTALAAAGADGKIPFGINGEAHVCDRLILATGGVSYPGTGSTGDGHRLLTALGVRVTPLSPSLVPVETKEDTAPLMGLSLKNVTLTVWRGEKEVFQELGEMLFTHFGLSGPLVLSASANMQKGNVTDYRFSVNLKPGLDEAALDRRVLGDLAEYSARDFCNALEDLLPRKLIPWVVAASGVPAHKKAGALTREERGRLVCVLRALPFTPRAFRPLSEAIVTCGGVDVREVSPVTMELKRFPGIYCVGELLDLDAYTGGYNLQIAFSTAYAAGCAAAV